MHAFRTVTWGKVGYPAVGGPAPFASSTRGILVHRHHCAPIKRVIYLICLRLPTPS